MNRNLDLACGPTAQPGYLGVDLHAGPGQYKADLQEYPWDWARTLGRVDRIYCSHFVEHVADLVAFMNEVHSILVSGGVATIVHPYQHSNRAWQDPTHVRALNEDSWNYYNREWRQANNVDHYLGITANFDVDIQFMLNPAFHAVRESHKAQVIERMRYSVNVVDDLVVTLTKR